MAKKKSIYQECLKDGKMYKYCTSEIFDKYLSKGEFRLGSLSYYRREYEEGAGYGDELEGIHYESVKGDYTSGENPFLDSEINEIGGTSFSNVKIRGNFSMGSIGFKSETDCHILSFSREYSVEQHKVWLQREKCNYDLALEINAYAFSMVLGEYLKKMWGDGYNHECFEIGPVKYGEKNSIINHNGFERDEKKLLEQQIFIKKPKFTEEKELRYVVNLLGHSEPLEPTNIKLSNTDFITDVISLR